MEEGEESLAALGGESRFGRARGASPVPAAGARSLVGAGGCRRVRAASGAWAAGALLPMLTCPPFPGRAAQPRLLLYTV